jgi:hypothetical protein
MLAGKFLVRTCCVRAGSLPAALAKLSKAKVHESNAGKIILAA